MPQKTLIVLAGAAVVMMIGHVFLVKAIELDQGRSQPGQALHAPGLMALGFASGTSLAWAIGVMVMDNVVNTVEPIPAAAIRISFMALILVGITAFTGDIRHRSRSRLDMSVAGVRGLLLGACTLTFTSALKWSSPATVVILNSTAPLFVVPIAITWLHERVTRRVAIGTVACFPGVVLTSL